ncbi:MAG: hypothetical protein M3070_17155 [Actinomycetota bacterium]|nr:hypothetical protein [Actinomycetota bacterium]
MLSSSRGTPVRVAVAIVSLLLGLVCLGFWRVLSGAEKLPYADGATPPSTVKLSQGKSYSLAVPGGVPALQARGAPGGSGGTITPSCVWSIGNSDVQSLTISTESVDTKAVNTFAHFDAPASGRLHISCSNWGTVFVPDSDDRQSDLAFWYLVLSVLFLSIGLPLTLAVLRRAIAARSVLVD